MSNKKLNESQQQLNRKKARNKKLTVVATTTLASASIVGGVSAIAATEVNKDKQQDKINNLIGDLKFIANPAGSYTDSSAEETYLKAQFGVSATSSTTSVPTAEELAAGGLVSIADLTDAKLIEFLTNYNGHPTALSGISNLHISNIKHSLTSVTRSNTAPNRGSAPVSGSGATLAPASGTTYTVGQSSGADIKDKVAFTISYTKTGTAGTQYFVTAPLNFKYTPNQAVLNDPSVDVTSTNLHPTFDASSTYYNPTQVNNIANWTWTTKPTGASIKSVTSTNDNPNTAGTVETDTRNVWATVKLGIGTNSTATRDVVVPLTFGIENKSSTIPTAAQLFPTSNGWAIKTGSNLEETTIQAPQAIADLIWAMHSYAHVQYSTDNGGTYTDLFAYSPSMQQSEINRIVSGILLDTSHSIQDSMAAASSIPSANYPVKLRVINSDPSHVYLGATGADDVITALSSGSITTTSVPKLVSTGSTWTIDNVASSLDFEGTSSAFTVKMIANPPLTLPTGTKLQIRFGNTGAWINVTGTAQPITVQSGDNWNNAAGDWTTKNFNWRIVSTQTGDSDASSSNANYVIKPTTATGSTVGTSGIATADFTGVTKNVAAVSLNNLSLNRASSSTKHIELSNVPSLTNTHIVYSFAVPGSGTIANALGITSANLPDGMTLAQVNANAFTLDELNKVLAVGNLMRADGNYALSTIYANLVADSGFAITGTNTPKTIWDSAAYSATPSVPYLNKYVDISAQTAAERITGLGGNTNAPTWTEPATHVGYHFEYRLMNGSAPVGGWRNKADTLTAITALGAGGLWNIGTGVAGSAGWRVSEIQVKLVADAGYVLSGASAGTTAQESAVATLWDSSTSTAIAKTIETTTLLGKITAASTGLIAGGMNTATTWANWSAIEEIATNMGIKIWFQVKSTPPNAGTNTGTTTAMDASWTAAGWRATPPNRINPTDKLFVGFSPLTAGDIVTAPVTEITTSAHIGSVLIEQAVGNLFLVNNAAGTELAAFQSMMTIGGTSLATGLTLTDIPTGHPNANIELSFGTPGASGSFTGTPTEILTAMRGQSGFNLWDNTIDNHDGTFGNWKFGGTISYRLQPKAGYTLTGTGATDWHEISGALTGVTKIVQAQNALNSLVAPTGASNAFTTSGYPTTANAHAEFQLVKNTAAGAGTLSSLLGVTSAELQTKTIDGTIISGAEASAIITKLDGQNAGWLTDREYKAVLACVDNFFVKDTNNWAITQINTRYVANGGFTLDGSAQTRTLWTSSGATNTKYVSTTAGDNNAVFRAGSNSKNIDIDIPAINQNANLFDFKFRLVRTSGDTNLTSSVPAGGSGVIWANDTSTGNTGNLVTGWLTKDELKTYVANIASGEGLWDSTQMKWLASKIEVQLIAKSGYAISDAQVQDLWVNTSTDLPKFVNVGSQTSGIIKNLIDGIDADADSASNHVTWGTSQTLIDNLRTRGVNVEFQLTTTNTAPGTNGWGALSTLTADYDRTKRFLWMRVTAVDSNPNDAITEYVLSPQIVQTGATPNPTTAGVYNITATSGIAAVKQFITVPDSTTIINAGKALFAGNTHNLTGSVGALTGASDAPSGGENRFTIHFSFNNFGATTGAGSDVDVNSLATSLGLAAGEAQGLSDMTEAQFKALFNGSKGNLWNQTANAWVAQNIYIKLVPVNENYVLSDNGAYYTIDLSQIPATGFAKYVNTSALATEYKTGTDHIRFEAGSEHDKVVWGALPTLGSSWAGIGSVKFLVGGNGTNYATLAEAKAAAASSWSAALPTSVDQVHANRHIWVKFEAASGYVLDSTDPIDLTSTSGIQNIITHVITANKDLSTFVLTGDTHLPTLVVPTGWTNPYGAHRIYSIDGGTTWLGDTNASGSSDDELIAAIKAASTSGTIHIRNIKVKFEVDSALFAIHADTVGDDNDRLANVGITGFNTYRDISAQQRLLVENRGTDTELGIRLEGLVNVNNGIMISIPAALKQDALDALGLTLQFKINSDPYQDFVGGSTVMAANDPRETYDNGTPADTSDDIQLGFTDGVPAGQYQVVTLPKPSNSAAPTITFRIVPNKDDAGQGPATAWASSSTWQQRVAGVQLTTSDIVARGASGPTELVWDASTLPQLVKTSKDDLATLVATGSTKDLRITGNPDVATILGRADRNPGMGYGTGKIDIGYQLTINGSNSTYFLRYDDFINWLDGDFVVGTGADANKVYNGNSVIQVYNATSNRLEDMPVSMVKPDWNSIKPGNFAINARWISTNPGFRPSDGNIFALDISAINIWTDLTTFLADLGKIDILGNTDALTSATTDDVTVAPQGVTLTPTQIDGTTLAAIQAALDAQFGAGVFKIVSTANIQGGVPTWSDATINGKNVSPTDGLVDEINHNYDLGFKIVPGANGTRFIASRIGTDTETAPQIVWDKGTAALIQKMVHTADSEATSTISGNTKVLTIVEPTIVTTGGRNTWFHLEYQLVRSGDMAPEPANFASVSGTNWVTVDVLKTYISGLKEGLWNSAADKWVASSIKVKMVANTGYVLDNAREHDLWTSSQTNALVKFIDVTSILGELTNAQSGVRVQSNQDHMHIQWHADSATLIAKAQRLGVKVEFLSNTGATPTGGEQTGTDATAQNVWLPTPPTQVDYDLSERHIWMRLSASDANHVLSAQTPATGIYEITSSAAISSLTTFVDTGTTAINRGLFTGDTHRLTGATTTVDQGVSGSGARYEVHYSLTNFGHDPINAGLNSALGITGNIKDDMTEAEFKALFDGSHGNLWNQISNNWPSATITVKLVPLPRAASGTPGQPNYQPAITYVLSSDHYEQFTLESLIGANFKKYIETAGLVALYNSGATKVTATGGDSTTPTWSALPDLDGANDNDPRWYSVLTGGTGPTARTGGNIEFLYLEGNWADDAAGNAAAIAAAKAATSGWSTDLPDYVGLVHDQRHLFVRFTPNNGYVLDNNIFDLTWTSGIQGIITDVPTTTLDTLTAGTAGNKLSEVRITGTTANAQIAEVSIPTGSKLVYSWRSDASGDKLWVDKTTFLSEIANPANNANVHRDQMFVKLVSFDDTKFVVKDDHEHAMDVTGLLTYRDLNQPYAPGQPSIYSLLGATASVSTGIVLEGTINTVDGIMIEIPHGLSEEILAPLGLVLQFKINSQTTWNNFDSPDTAYDPNDPANTGKGFPAMSAGDYQIITLPKDGAIASKITFRIVPNLDDNGHAPTTAFDGTTTYQDRYNGVHLTTSDIVGNPTANPAEPVGPKEVVWDASTLPERVFVNIHDLDSITISGNSKDANIVENVDERGVLNVGNPGMGYEQYIKIGFRANDGRLDTDYYFQSQADFIAWLDGRLTISNGKLMNGGAPVQVFDASAPSGQPTLVDLPVSMQFPDWNNIQMDSFVVRWISINEHYKPFNNDVTPGQSVDLPLTITSGQTFKKWVDLTVWIEELKHINVSGDTDNLASTDSDLTDTRKSLDAIVAELTAAFGAGVFDIVSTAKFDASGNPLFDDATKTATNGLPDEINFEYQLGFKIVPGANDGNFVASLLSADTTGTTTQTPVATATWDKVGSSSILKFIHTRPDALSTNVVLSGNTKALAIAIQSAVFKSNKDGVLDANGTYTDGLDVFVKTSAGANNNFMPVEVMVAYLSGNLEVRADGHLWVKANGSVPAADMTLKYTSAVFGQDYDAPFGFPTTAGPIAAPAFDGSWGRESFSVKYVVKAGYITETGSVDAQSERHPNVDAVDRFIDISAVVAGARSGASSVKVTSPDTTKGWWDEAKADFSDHRSWNGYIDNQHFGLTDITIPADLHIKIQYSIDGGSTWSDNKPTVFADTPAQRNLHIKFVYNGDEYGTGEEAIISDTASYDITTNSGIRDLLIYVSTANVSLGDIAFTGDTRHISENLAGAHVPANTHIEYSITNFKGSGASTPADVQEAIDALASMGILPTGNTKPIYDAYMANPSMTFTEFTAWITSAVAVVGVSEVFRDSISARIVPNAGYSILQPDDTATRDYVNVDNLFTFRNVNAFTSFLQLGDGTTGINLLGQKTTPNGIFVKIPAGLETLLANSGLELQWTTDGVANGVTSGTGTRVTLGTNPTWHDAVIVSASGVSIVGVNPTDRGFVTTLNPIVNGESFIAFRIVPIRNDRGVAVVGDYATDTTTHTVLEYQRQTMMQLFANINNALVQMPEFYSIDTTQIPTVINVDDSAHTFNLDQIIGSGDTKNISILLDELLKAHPGVTGGAGSAHTALFGGAGTSVIDDLNTDATVDNNLQLVFAIDNKDGSFVDGVATGANVNWLTQEDFIAYLAGTLVVKGGRVVHNEAGPLNGQEVEILTPLIGTWHKQDNITTTDVDESTQTGLSENDVFGPNYRLIGTTNASGQNSIFVKWVSASKDYANMMGTQAEPYRRYIPGDSAPHAITYTPDTMRKWFNGTQFLTQIRATWVEGDTHSWHFNTSAAPFLDPNWLTANGLKIQYSLDGTTWSDTQLNFMTLTWAQQVARTFKIRVVPNAYTGTTGVIGRVESAGIVVDYGTGIKAEASPITNKQTNGVDLFQVYLDIDRAILANIEIRGNNFEVTSLDWADAFKAVPGNANIVGGLEQYSEVEIEYLFNGVWYNKAALLAEMTRIRTAATASQAGATALTLPTDFTHATVQARFRVLHPNSYVIKDETKVTEGTGANAVEKEVSADQNSDASIYGGTEVIKTSFKTFVNIWDVQTNAQTGANFLSTFTRTAGTTTVTGQSAVIELSGSVNSLTMNLFLDTLMAGAMANHHMKLQWSVVENPGAAIDSSDWNDVASGLMAPMVIQNQPLNPRTRTLWIRFVSNDEHYVLSNVASNGNGSTSIPISVDTSLMKFEITTDHNALLGMTISGDTQSGLVANINDFLVAHSLTNGSNGVLGINEFYEVDANGAKSVLTDVDAINRLISTYGLTVRFKVTSTRTKGTGTEGVTRFVAGTSYEFDTFAQLMTALGTTNLNFDRSTLQVQWGILPSGQAAYTVSDRAWVHPTLADSLVNVIYTEDVYSLTKDTLVVTGNNIALQAPTPNANESKTTIGTLVKFARDVFAPAPDAQTPSYLAALGLKIQFNIVNTNGAPDSGSWTDVAPTGGLNGAKDYWIRFAPISADYKLASNAFAADPSQITKLEVDAIKLAIPFQFTSVQDIIDAIAAAAVEGTTYDFHYVTGHELPLPGASADLSTSHYRIQYSRDNVLWANDIAGALAGSDYYQTGVLGFDKDRGDKLYIRYVYEETSGNVTPANSHNYVFTDTLGHELTLAQLQRGIPIDSLIQPIRIDQALSELTGQQTITYPNLTNPNNQANFAGSTWKDVANFGAFKPVFVVGSNPELAKFVAMGYDGQYEDQSHASIFGMGRNPFDPNAPVQDRSNDPWNLLAPRHTHFEFRYMSSQSATWTTWAPSLPQELNKDSNYKGFQVRLAADTGYLLPDGTYSTGATFALDGSSRTAGTNIPDQNWQREYNIVIEYRTSDVSLPQSGIQAEFVGFNVTDRNQPGAGTFKTDDPNQNYSQGNIIINFLKGGLPYNVSADGFVLEYNVKDSSGREITWTDKNGVTASGWHTSGTRPEDAPTSQIPWYGPYPTSLRNGDVISVRLRARNGFVIYGDTQALNYDSASKTSPWSHSMDLRPVTGLINRIDVPQGFAIYDTQHLTDMAGQQMQAEAGMPTIQFRGNEGSGQIVIIDPNSQREFHYEVAVLRPFPYNGVQEEFNSVQLPTDGWRTQDANGNWVNVFTRRGGWIDTNTQDGWATDGSRTSVMDWQQDLVWQDPSSVSGLSVGDVLVFKLVANTGYGFQYEERSSQFSDIWIPKTESDTLYGTKQLADLQYKFSTNEGVTPVPVRGLTVRPDYDLSSLQLVYSNNPKERINNGQEGSAVITLNNLPVPHDSKWSWYYRTTRDSGTSDWTRVGDKGELATNLVNGNRIEFMARVNDGYIMDPTYNNNPVSFTIQGLKDPITIDSIPRPVVQVGGYEGHGTIVGIEQYLPSGGNYDSSLWGLIDPTGTITPSTGGRQTIEQIRDGIAPVIPQPLLQNAPDTDNDGISGIRWEYLVSDKDPATMSDSELKELETHWSPNPPTNLRNGQFVRMRIGTNDADDVALGRNVVVYSYSDATSAREGSTNASDQLKLGWMQVSGMMLNPDNIDLDVEIKGFREKTTIDPQFNILIDEDTTLDEKAVTMMFSINGGEWMLKEDERLKHLDNGDTITVKVVAKSGWAFNPNDTDSTTHITHVVDGNVDEWEMYKDEWTFTVAGLLKYLDINGLSLSEFNVIPTAQNPGANGEIVDGFATIDPITVNNIDSVIDVDKNTTYWIDANNDGVHDQGEDHPLSELIGVRYRVRAIDPITGLQKPEYIIEDGDGVPTGLSNGDIIFVEVYVKDSGYKLSQNLSRQLVVSGLITTINEPVSDPILQFDGESGHGTVIVSPTSPNRTKWVYSVVGNPTPNQPLPIIDDYYARDQYSDQDQHYAFGQYTRGGLVFNEDGSPLMITKTITENGVPVQKQVQAAAGDHLVDDQGHEYSNWVDSPPVNLRNGDYVIAQLVSSVAGSAGLKVNNISRPGETPMNQNWVKVTGLAMRIDLSRLSFDSLIDPSNPHEPTRFVTNPGQKNFAFKVVGDQEGQAFLEINSPFYSEDLTERLRDSFGNIVSDEYAQYLQWGFAVNNNPEDSLDYSYSPTLPNKLENGQYIHVTIMVKPGYDNIEVYGFKPMTIKVEGLVPPASISSKMITMIAGVVGGVVVLGGAVASVFLIRKRKKRLKMFED